MDTTFTKKQKSKLNETKRKTDFYNQKDGSLQDLQVQKFIEKTFTI